MRIDLVSIFPDYFAPLTLSLPGKARDKGLLDIAVHDLRDWAHDRHRTVDDTPYGGGAGMVMKPEPWGEALDALVGPRTTVVFTTPSGQPLTQALARELAAEEHLVFACGRYEGIDQRVIDHAGSVASVREISIGDYVLNGGEVAALAITEAVVRLLPGFMGNPDSLVEESHEDGLLEYPVYTKPAAWRGHHVPDVLLSGNHRLIADWRHDQAVRRTVARRPDLLPPTATADTLDLVPATLADAGELMTLQRACWVQEALLAESLNIPALTESLDVVRQGIQEWQTWIARVDGRLVASVRAHLTSRSSSAADPTSRSSSAAEERGGVSRRPEAADPTTRSSSAAEERGGVSRRSDAADPASRSSSAADLTSRSSSAAEERGGVSRRPEAAAETIWEIGRLMVAPDLQGRGFGRMLLAHAEAAAPTEATSYQLWTGEQSGPNLRFYKRAGYRRIGRVDDLGVVILSKAIR